MTRMYRVTLWVESDGEPEDDPVVEKTVEASDKHAAIALARTRVREEDADLNHMKIWAWTVESVPALPET